MQSDKNNRIVIKVGSGLLVSEKTSSGLNETFIGHLVKQLGELHYQGKEIVLVTSGAVAIGKKQNSNYPMGRAAMVGQIKLMLTYQRFFNELDSPIRIGQALYTYHDLEESASTRTKQRLLDGFKYREITIVNANDAVVDAELEALKDLEDNDKLAAKLAVLIEADTLLFLTEVDGLYKNYGKKEQELIKNIFCINKNIISFAKSSHSKVSKGGMLSKIKAAQIVTKAGIKTIIFNGKKSNSIKLVLQNRLGTVFLPFKKKLVK